MSTRRPWTEAERKAASERMRAANLAGKQKRKAPMSEAEREMHRKRMMGNTLGKANVMSEERRIAHSARMKKSNPMKSPETVAKMRSTLVERHGEDFSSRLFKGLWREGRIKGRPLSERAKALASERMKLANPMKDPVVAAKARASFTEERRGAASARMKLTWQEGKIEPAMFRGKGNVKGANKTERKLFPILRYYHGRFVGDGTFWLKVTESGICRNPDFIFGSGKQKTALLVHGVYWHRDTKTAEIEIEDYRQAGWHLLVLWVKHLSDWMMPAVKAEIKSWLDEAASSPSQMPVIRQFMTWNADRTTTS